MIEHEQRTYDQWLSAPDVILSALRADFEPIRERIGWGKLLYQGRAR